MKIARRAWPKRAALLLAAGAAVAALVWAFVPERVRVDTAEVRRGRFVQTVVADGKTRVKARYIVSAPVAGTLLRVELKPGDEIKRGMLLGTLLPTASPLLDVRSEREARERLGAAEAVHARSAAAADRANTNLGLAKSDHERLARLLQRGSVPAVDVERADALEKMRRKELEAAEFDADAAAHELEVARAALQHVTAGPDRGTSRERRWEIRSATAGRVLRVFQESEAVLPAGTAILEVGDPGSMEVVVDVLSTDAVQIRPGAEVQIERWGGETELGAHVRLVEPSAFTKVSALGVEEQRVNVVLDLADPPEPRMTLGDGFRVEAAIVVYTEDDALSVPVSALVRDRESWAVFVVKEGRAVLKPVELGRRNASVAVVKSGLEPGARVVLYPGDQVRNGTRVRFS